MSGSELERRLDDRVAAKGDMQNGEELGDTG